MSDSMKINALTSSGNGYHKTNTNKNIGITVGVLSGVGTFAALSYAKKNITTESFLNYVKEFLEKPNTQQKLNKVFKSFKISASVVVGLAVLCGGAIIGKVVDAIVNKVRANKADKAALAKAQENNKQQ